MPEKIDNGGYVHGCATEGEFSLGITRRDWLAGIIYKRMPWVCDIICGVPIGTHEYFYLIEPGIRRRRQRLEFTKATKWQFRAYYYLVLSGQTTFK